MVQSIMLREAWQQGPTMSGYSSVSFLFSLLIQPRTSACGVALVTFRVGLPFSVKSLWKLPNRQTYPEVDVPGDSKSSQADSEDTESQVIFWSSLLSHPQALPVSPGTSKGGFSSLFVTPLLGAPRLSSDCFPPSAVCPTELCACLSVVWSIPSGGK